MWNFYKFRNNVAFINNSEKIFYKDLIYYSSKIEKKLRKKSLTLLLTDNSVDSIICYVSLVKKRFPILILDKKISKNFLKKIIAAYKPENICCEVKDNFFENNKDFLINFKLRNFKFLKNKEKDKFEVKNNLSILATTSGTTGSFKLIRQSYHNITSNTSSITRYLKLNKNHITITNLPLSYTFGMSIINTHLEVGSKIIVTTRTIFEKEFWKLFKVNNINIIYGVPYTYEILDKLKFFSKNISSVKLFAQAGGKINEKLQKKIGLYIRKYKKLFFIMYGQAEATTRISYLPPKQFSKKLGSIGLPIPGGKIKLVGKNNLVIKKPKIVGELVYQGKNVCMGYTYNRHDLNKKNQWNGQIFTGDLAKRDSEGYYYIVGRKKRFAKIYGISVNLDDIENLLKSKFSLLNVAVISSKNKIKIFSSIKGISNEIYNFLRKNINIPVSSFDIAFIKKIPQLKNGKNNYKLLSNYS